MFVLGGVRYTNQVPWDIKIYIGKKKSYFWAFFFQCN